MRIGIVAGETSGDILAASLIASLKTHYPDALFEGVPGPLMKAEGCAELFPQDRLAVMGLTEVLGRLFELLSIRRALAKRFSTQARPDVFVGVDAPDFTLGLERRLRRAGVPCVHYVSPSVWAWRQYRVKKIARSTDLMLTLFPFEADFYQRHGLQVEFVGHPLADVIPLNPDAQRARAALALDSNAEYVALLPGSRVSEVSRLGPLMLKTASWCLQRRPGLRFVAPMASPALKSLFSDMMAAQGNLPLTLVDGRSRDVMEAANTVLLASGTATLEAMLLKRPMVVTYRVSALTYWLVKRLAAVSRVALPNLLAGEDLVPELIQDQATPPLLGAAVLAYLEAGGLSPHAHRRFNEIHHQLRRNAAERAAVAVSRLIESQRR